MIPFWHYNFWGFGSHFFSFFGIRFLIKFVILYSKYREARLLHKIKSYFSCSECPWTFSLAWIHKAGNQHWTMSQAMNYEKQYFDVIHTRVLNPPSHKIALTKGNSIFKAHSGISGYVCSQAEFVHHHLCKGIPGACIAPASHKWKSNFDISTSGKYMVNALLGTSGDCISPL